jgi:hypothetical protein
MAEGFPGTEAVARNAVVLAGATMNLKLPFLSVFVLPADLNTPSIGETSAWRTTVFVLFAARPLREPVSVTAAPGSTVVPAGLRVTEPAPSAEGATASASSVTMNAASGGRVREERERERERIMSGARCRRVQVFASVTLRVQNGP